MRQVVTAREANQYISQYLRAVVNGESFIITLHGKPVAELRAVSKNKALTAQQAKAFKRLECLMDEGQHLGGKTFKREDLYDR